MDWRTGKGLGQSEGLAYVRRELEPYDWSGADWITVRRGKSQRSIVRGLCRFPANGRGYRLNATISTVLPYPAEIPIRVRPLYRNPDGTWPEVPEGHKLGQLFYSANTSREWHRLYRTTIFHNEDEAVVWIIGHEAFHYLRRTRQITGRQGEIQADAFADEMLQRYRQRRRESLPL